METTHFWPWQLDIDILAIILVLISFNDCIKMFHYQIVLLPKCIWSNCPGPKCPLQRFGLTRVLSSYSLVESQTSSGETYFKRHLLSIPSMMHSTTGQVLWLFLLVMEVYVYLLNADVYYRAKTVDRCFSPGRHCLTSFVWPVSSCSGGPRKFTPHRLLNATSTRSPWEPGC